jgi:hypothetical protein
VRDSDYDDFITSSRLCLAQGSLKEIMEEATSQIEEETHSDDDLGEDEIVYNFS